MGDRITVIVPTMLHPGRARLIRRAVDSVLEQADVDVRVVLVVNGSPDTDPELEGRSGVEVLRLASANLPAALQAGRRTVEDGYFSFLDDDDHLLPGSLATRLRLLESHPECDAVVTNGLVRGPEGERPFEPAMTRFAADPLLALAERNWLAPGSTLMRADRVPVSLFEGMPRFLEWTYVAARLASTRRILFDDEPTFVYGEDAPDRVSESDAYLFGQPAALARVLSLDLPAPLREKLERDRSMALHGIADVQLARGERVAAWRAHLASLAGRGGWRFLPFTRKLVGLP
jgi:glycosyltransferase involved in cell wall biosynthesis